MDSEGQRSHEEKYKKIVDGKPSGLSVGLLVGAVVIPRVRRRVIILSMERQLAARSIVENLGRGVVDDRCTGVDWRCVLGNVESWWCGFRRWIVRRPGMSCGWNGGRRCRRGTYGSWTGGGGVVC